MRDAVLARARAILRKASRSPEFGDVMVYALDGRVVAFHEFSPMISTVERRGGRLVGTFNCSASLEQVTQVLDHEERQNGTACVWGSGR